MLIRIVQTYKIIMLKYSNITDQFGNTLFNQILAFCFDLKGDSNL